MVPDLEDRSARDGGAQVESFHLYNPSGHSTYDRRHFAGPKIVTDHLPPQDIDLRPSSRGLTTSCAFCPTLKAIPLASFYKLHRLPPVITMNEKSVDTYDSIHLPTQPALLAPEMPEKSPQHAVHNKLLEQVVRTPGREPSPQPTHLSVPGASQHRILQEEGPGYVAPKFEGKDLQMDQGKYMLRLSL